MLIAPGSPAAAALASALQARPCWSVVTGGMLHVVAVDAPGRVALSDALAGCDVVVARRRHGELHGPVAGFRVSPGRAALWTLADFDTAPWVDGAPSPWTRSGVEALVVGLRVYHGEVEVVLPDGLLPPGGPPGPGGAGPGPRRR